MVRFKKRYFVVQLDREKDIYDPFSKHHQASLKPRAIQDSRPLDIPDGVLAATVKDLVQQIHGDFGRASITTGLRTIYCNSEKYPILMRFLIQFFSHYIDYCSGKTHLLSEMENRTRNYGFTMEDRH